MRSFTAADIRDLFAATNFIDRDELEQAVGHKVSDEGWELFPASLPGIFRKLSDDRQDAVTALINSKLSPEVA